MEYRCVVPVLDSSVVVLIIIPSNMQIEYSPRIVIIAVHQTSHALFFYPNNCIIQLEIGCAQLIVQESVIILFAQPSID